MAIGLGVRQRELCTAREVAMPGVALSDAKVTIFPKSGNRIQEKVKGGGKADPIVGSLVG